MWWACQNRQGGKKQKTSKKQREQNLWVKSKNLNGGQRQDLGELAATQAQKSPLEVDDEEWRWGEGE